MNSELPQHEVKDGPARLRDLFAQVCELDPAVRNRFLDEECAGQPELRWALEDLLRADEGAQANTAWGRSALGMEARLTASAIERAPFDRLGPYHILERIGSGGMGVVYLAEGDYDGVRKRVAVKAIPFAFDEEMVRRFKGERRILAGLEHPNVARMLDAGTTPEGVPYLVMEYVDGLPVDQYAERHGLDKNARLRLFRPICDAVAYAHRNLIVHRDLKPGNILVTSDGVPKLLDFGIARLLEESRPEVTMVPMMTPKYASPEQLAGKPITTASDIYSLGVILRELVGDVAGDVNNVISMAMREEPERRYASAADLAEDVRRVMERYPIRARPDTLGYRIRRFASRRPAEVAVVLVLAAGLLIAGLVAIEEYRAANRRFNDVREVANSFLFEVYDAVADQPGTTKARAIIAARAQQYLDALARDRSNDRTVHRELAIAYGKLGDILGLPFAANLGDTAGAFRNYQKAAEMLEGLAATPAGRRDASLFTALGDVYEKLGRIESRRKRYAEGIDAAAQGVAARARAVSLNPSSIEARRALVNGNLMLAMCHGDAANAHDDTAELKLAESLIQGALAAARRLSVENPADESLQGLVSKACEYMAYGESDLARRTGEPEYGVRALHHHQEELNVDRMLYARNPDRYRRLLADALADVSRGWLLVGDGGQAETTGREGLAAFERIAAADPNNYEAARDVMVAHWNVAKALSAQNRSADAAAEFEAVLSDYEKLHRRNPEDRAEDTVVESRDWLAAHALAAGNRNQTIAQYRRNIEMLGAFAERQDVGGLAIEEERLGDALLPVDKTQAGECYARAAALWDKLRDSHQLPARYLGKAAELRLKIPGESQRPREPKQ
jgi:tetratricopeptide (TPR) repeat protein